jgi:hypothetical protein
MQLAVGTSVGPYEIRAPIGAGGMGEVYSARDTRLDRPFYTRSIFVIQLASICWTPDSRYLILSGSQNHSESNRILRVSVETGEVKTLAAAEGVGDGYTGRQSPPTGARLGWCGCTVGVPSSFCSCRGTSSRKVCELFRGPTLMWVPLPGQPMGEISSHR